MAEAPHGGRKGLNLDERLALCVCKRQCQDHRGTWGQSVVPLDEHAPKTDGSPQQAAGLLLLQVFRQKQDDKKGEQKGKIQAADANCTRWLPSFHLFCFLNSS